jgi:hypothetical protein
VRDASDDEQNEIGIIDDWEALKEKDREAIVSELGLHYFVPKVSQVPSIKNEFVFLYWKVLTDKGPQELVMRDSVALYAREVSPGRWLLIDVGQARHEIPDLNALDKHSKKLVKRYLYL